jgi:hypothetical protein
MRSLRREQLTTLPLRPPSRRGPSFLPTASLPCQHQEQPYQRITASPAAPSPIASTIAASQTILIAVFTFCAPLFEVFVLSFTLGLLGLQPIPLPSALPPNFPHFTPLLDNPGIRRDRVVVAGVGSGVADLAFHRRIHASALRED